MEIFEDWHFPETRVFFYFLFIVIYFTQVYTVFWLHTFRRLLFSLFLSPPVTKAPSHFHAFRSCFWLFLFCDPLGWTRDTYMSMSVEWSTRPWATTSPVTTSLRQWLLLAQQLSTVSSSPEQVFGEISLSFSSMTDCLRTQVLCMPPCRLPKLLWFPVCYGLVMPVRHRKTCLFLVHALSPCAHEVIVFND